MNNAQSRIPLNSNCIDVLNKKLEMHKSIYLDYHATTPCDPLVLEAMLPYFTEHFANPSSEIHVAGRSARNAVERSREHVATLIGAQSGEMLFTGGATESNNLAILGLAHILGSSKRRRIVTSAVEHKSILEPCRQLTQEEFDIVVLPVDRFGRIQIKETAAAIDDQTFLVSIQAANNEIGTIQPISEIAALAHERGALIHCDAAQAVGKIPVNVEEWDVDMMSFSAHKMYGPKGIGALYLRGGSNAIPLKPITFGGGQEKGLRPGTLNVPAIVGFGEACRIVKQTLMAESSSIESLRNRLEEELQGKIDGLSFNGDIVHRLQGTSSLTLPGVDAEALIINAKELILSTGSACTSGTLEPSHVLTAIGLSREEAYSTMRIGLGRFTTNEEIDQAVRILSEAFTKLNSSLPTHQEEKNTSSATLVE